MSDDRVMIERIAGALERIAAVLERVAPRQHPPAEDLPPPIRVVYDDQGVNQWGVKHHARCPLCESDYPSNSSGDGQCRQCGAKVNARMGTVTPAAPPAAGPPPRAVPESMKQWRDPGVKGDPGA